MSALIQGLPNDIAIMCLARVPYSLYPRLGGVSRSWREATRSPELFRTRQQLNVVEDFLCVSCAPATLWQLYDPRQDFWTTLPLLPSQVNGLSGFGVVSISGKVFVLGGRSDNKFDRTAEVWCYDTITRNWAARAPMLAPRASFGCCVLDGQIVVAGGFSRGRKHILSAEIYDPEHDVWTPLPNLKDTGSFNIVPSGFVIGDRVHVFLRVGPNEQYVQIFDRERLEWDIQNYGNSIDGPMVMVRGSVYNMSRGFLYKQERDERELIVYTYEFVKRNHFQMVGLGDDLYVIGGWIWLWSQTREVDSPHLSDVHVLTIGSEGPTWRQVASMTKCRGSISGCTNFRI